MKINEHYQANFDKLSDFEKKEILSLKDFLEKGKSPTIILFKVSKDGMSRRMAFLWVNNDGRIRKLNAEVIKQIEGEKPSKKYNPNFIVKGCGMDMALALLQNIQQVLGVSNKSQSYELVAP